MSTPAIIELTPSAISHIRKNIARRGKGVGIRLGVRTTGCSGLAYQMEYVDIPRADDLTFPYEDIMLFVDPNSIEYLKGTIIDFDRVHLNEGFKFINPNERDRCGCGESFRV